MQRIVLTLLFLVAAATIAGCAAQPVVNEAKELEPVEVRTYEGQNLSSIADFRENSIRGPQQIDRESYRLEITGLVEDPKT